MNGIKLRGTGRCVPANTVTNDDLSRLVDTNDEWITARTGIRSRYRCEKETLTELCVSAARDALNMAGITPADIGVCIVATVSADTVVPSAACLLQRALGLPEDTPCFDLNAACTGFVYALHTMECLLNASPRPFGLVVGAEALSRVVDWTDRSTCILFGDGAAAAVYRATEDDNLGIQSTFIAADGSGAEYLRMEALPVEDPFAEDRTVDPKARFLKMQGAAVVRFTARAVPQAIDTALQRAGITADDIDWVVPHQANLRILDVIARRYHLPKEKVYVNMDRFGNTSSASVPICLNEMRRNGLLREGQTIVCTGFGGGLTYGAFVLKL